MPVFGGWRPGVAVLGEVGVVGRRFGGPAVSLGLLSQASLGSTPGTGGARLGVTLHLRDDVDGHVAAWSGVIDELELSVRGGMYALPAGYSPVRQGFAGADDAPTDLN
jgi:hypothetical protein